MTYENFLKVIMTQRKMEQKIQKAYDIKIDLIDFVEEYSVMTQTLLTEIYTKEGYDWYSWFCWENDYGEKDWSKTTLRREEDGTFTRKEPTGEIEYGARDENGNPICYSFQSLWEYLESNYRYKDKFN